MSFSRLNYDDCSYQHILRESVSPGEYMLKAPRVDCDGGCYFPSPDTRVAKSGAASCPQEKLVDVDSELIGITRPATKCPTSKYLPQATPYCDAKLPSRECPSMAAEPTRISNGPCTLRGIPNGFNRWEWLCMNPQNKALVPFDFNIANRLVVKDNHRPCIPTPLDQSSSLPPAENMNVCWDWASKWSQGQYIPKVDAQNPPSWTLAVCPRIEAL